MQNEKDMPHSPQVEKFSDTDSFTSSSLSDLTTSRKLSNSPEAAAALPIDSNDAKKRPSFSADGMYKQVQQALRDRKVRLENMELEKKTLILNRNQGSGLSSTL